MPMDIETLKSIIANTPDGMHKNDLIRQLKRLYRKRRLNHGDRKTITKLKKG